MEEDEALDFEDGQVFEDEDEFGEPAPPVEPASQAAPASSGGQATLGIADLSDGEINELIAVRSGEAEATSVKVVAFLAAHRVAEQTACLPRDGGPPWATT